MWDPTKNSQCHRILAKIAKKSLYFSSDFFSEKKSKNSVIYVLNQKHKKNSLSKLSLDPNYDFTSKIPPALCLDCSILYETDLFNRPNAVKYWNEGFFQSLAENFSPRTVCNSGQIFHNERNLRLRLFQKRIENFSRFNGQLIFTCWTYTVFRCKNLFVFYQNLNFLNV